MRGLTPIIKQVKSVRDVGIAPSEMGKQKKKIPKEIEGVKA